MLPKEERPARALSSVDWLGSRAAFHGYLWAKESTGGWEGELTGNLSDLDLDASISAHFPHTLSGSVNVQLERARFRQGRMVEAIGAVTGNGGTVSRSLLAAGQRCLNLDAETDTSSPELIPHSRQRIGLFCVPGFSVFVTSKRSQPFESKSIASPSSVMP